MAPSLVRLAAAPVAGAPSSFLFRRSAMPRDLHSFPTRRSSDLHLHGAGRAVREPGASGHGDALRTARRLRRARLVVADRKSTRLNSSHSQISYAVFCLKKKTGLGLSSACLRIWRAKLVSTKGGW